MIFLQNLTTIIMAQAPGYTVDTAIGPMPTDLCQFISKFASIAAGIAGVAAVGLLAYGGFTLLTSTGEPEKLMAGREIITNALMGLALIILSVFVLEVLGWDILNLGKYGVNFSGIC